MNAHCSVHQTLEAGRLGRGQPQIFTVGINQDTGMRSQFAFVLHRRSRRLIAGRELAQGSEG